MMTWVFQLVTLLCVFGTIYGGVRDGAFAACYSVCRTLLCFIVAMTFYEPLAHLIASLIPRLGNYPGPDYLRAITFPTLFALVMGLGRHLKIKYTGAKTPALPLVDKIVGPVVGLPHGLLVAGVIMFMYSLMPFPRYMPNDWGTVDERRVVYDAGAGALRFYSFLTRRMRGARPFLLEDEPIVTDENGNGVVDPGSGDEWRDVVPNGRWDRGALFRYRHGDEWRMEELEKSLNVEGGG
jgi:hypothetical protein